MNPVVIRIHEWAMATDRFGDWHLDAFRRVCETGRYTPQDVDELELMCLAANQIALPEGAEAQKPRILDLGKDTAIGNETGAVSITSLASVQNVNRLAPEQKLTFAPTGMTIVYGDNGAGKSGYARILRALCRARCTNRVMLPDIFADAQGPAGATVGFRVGDADVSAGWIAGQAPPRPLASVSVFDSDCATVHVTAQNDIAFTPFGLDVLPKLANLFVELRDRFRARLAAARPGRPGSLDAVASYPNTITARFIAGLDAKTDLVDVRRHSAISEAEQRRQRDLVTLLAQDPATHARVLEVRHGRLIQLRDLCDRGFESLGDVAVAELNRLWEAARVAAQAADLGAHDALAPDDLPGVGGQVWRIFWEAARRYSQEGAYVGQEFPVIADASRCVLCQQVLQPGATQRLRRFEEFVRGEVRRVADVAAAALRAAIQPLSEMDCGPGVTSDNVKELSLEDADLAGVVQEVLAHLEVRRLAILRNCDAAAWEGVPPIPENPHGRVTAVLSAVEQRRQDYLRAAEAEERDKLQAELKELQSREWLASVLPDVEQEVARLVHVERLEACLRDVATDQITRKNTELTDEFITAALQQAFKDELKAIGLGYLGIELAKVGGQYGSTRYQVKVAGARRDADLPAIVSEGELRAIAVAAFLAELATAPSRSGLIFDDPVSSLDHRWRHRIAKRLAEEAARRQIIVFTHDIVFLHAMLDESERIGQTPSVSHVLRTPQGTGVCLDGVPWVAAPVSRRIGYLKDRAKGAAAIYRKDGEQAYEARAGRIYGLLREAWERAIEEILLGQVVIRFGREVQTQRLRYATDITDEDLKVVDVNMGRCSTFMHGHDEAAELNESMPDPDALLADIEVLESWVQAIRKRRKM